MSEQIDAWRQKLRQRRAELRAGKRRPKKRQVFRDFGGRSEKCQVTGAELVTKEGLVWLHRLGQALIVAGVAYDSQVDRGSSPGHVAFALQRIIPGAIPRPGLWEHWQIPVGAVNGHDTRWVMRLVLQKKEADIVTTEFFR